MALSSGRRGSRGSLRWLLATLCENGGPFSRNDCRRRQWPNVSTLNVSRISDARPSLDAAAVPLPYGMFRAILLALRRRRQMKAMKAMTERKTVTVGTTAAAISGPAR